MSTFSNKYIFFGLQLQSQLGLQQALLKFYEEESENCNRFFEAAKCVTLIKEIERQIEQNDRLIQFLSS